MRPTIEVTMKPYCSKHTRPLLTTVTYILIHYFLFNLLVVFYKKTKNYSGGKWELKALTQTKHDT